MSEKLKTEFKISVKLVSYFLGLKIKLIGRVPIKICQEAYAKIVL